MYCSYTHSQEYNVVAVEVVRAEGLYEMEKVRLKTANEVLRYAKLEVDKGLRIVSASAKKVNDSHVEVSYMKIYVERYQRKNGNFCVCYIYFNDAHEQTII